MHSRTLLLFEWDEQSLKQGVYLDPEILQATTALLLNVSSNDAVYVDLITHAGDLRADAYPFAKLYVAFREAKLPGSEVFLNGASSLADSIHVNLHLIHSMKRKTLESIEEERLHNRLYN